MKTTIDPIIQTISGKSVNLTKPRCDDIDIFDIARALSKICRFTGHTAGFYSVAEHSVECSNLILSLVPSAELATLTEDQKRALQLEALLHDAAEAYLGDVSRPLKSLLNSYKALERLWEPVIVEAFGLQNGKSSYVAKADQIMNVTEFKHLMGKNPSNELKHVMVVPYDEAIDDFKFRLLNHEDAFNLFYDRFIELTINPAIVKAAFGLRKTNSISSTLAEDGQVAAANEHLIKLAAEDLVDKTESILRNYVQTVAGARFLSEPDNTIKGELTALLLSYSARMGKLPK